MDRSTSSGFSCDDTHLNGTQQQPEGDEQLLKLARDQNPRARNKLLLRYYGQAARLIDSHAHRYRLSHADAQDAHQEAVFWILEAVKCYDTDQLATAQACQFRTFLFQVLRARLIDFVRRRGRVERHFDRSAKVSDVFGEDFHGDVPVRPRMTRIADLEDEPWRCAQRHEAEARLHAVLSQADREGSALWELTIDGNMSLRTAAAELGISYDAAKRRRRQLLAAVRRALEDLNGL